VSRPGAFGASQVPEASLVTCHSLRTPAAFHDLTDCGRFLLTSRPLKRSSTATILDFGAVPAIQGVRPPLWPATFSVYASPVLFTAPCRLSSAQALRHRRNTRYGWVANPFPTGTCTLQDAPSFAWRNNGKHHRQRRGQAPSRHFSKTAAVSLSGGCAGYVLICI